MKLIPYFGDRPLERIGPTEVNRFMRSKKEEGLATKTITNHLTFLHGVFRFAISRGWAAVNPIDAVDRPRSSGGDPDIHYLTLAEVEALLAAVEPGYLADTDRTLYLVAATTGLRQGELIALRWQDVDWTARRLRVRRTYTRGQFGRPKSRRSSRSVPLTERAAESSPLTESVRPTARTVTSCCLIRTQAIPSTPLAFADASRKLSSEPRCGRSASTISVIRLAPTVPPRVYRCGPCRSGWDTVT